MHNELICVEVQCRCRLHASHIRAVAEFCLGVASDYLPMVHQGKVILGLGFRTYSQDHLGEHFHVVGHGVCTSEHEWPVESLAALV